MARGFGSRGFSSRGGGGARGGSAARGGSKSRPSSGAGHGTQRNLSKSNSAKPKGQVRDGKVVQYSIKDPKGNTKYIGTTNNPTRRASEHRESGKLGQRDKLVVETKPVSRTSAEKVERGKLSSHRQQHGRNPKHNTTNDGKFHQRRLFG